jgi:carbon storage regulator
MLILTRRVGEKIVVNDDIVITVVEVGRDTVRIGIEAPRSVSVHRHEVWSQIVTENEAALAGDSAGLTSGASPVSTSSLPTGNRRPPAP